MNEHSLRRKLKYMTEDQKVRLMSKYRASSGYYYKKVQFEKRYGTFDPFGETYSRYERTYGFYMIIKNDLEGKELQLVPLKIGVKK